MTTAHATATLNDRQGELRRVQAKLLKAGKAKGDRVYGKMLDTLARNNEELKGLLEDSMPSTKQSGDHNPGTVTSDILAPLYEGEKIEVDATDGTETFVSASDFVIGYIDPDYARLTKDRPAKPTQAKKASVMELVQNADFETMYGSLGTNLAWESEADVINFCRKHRDKLLQGVYANFFRLEVDGESFVAGVRVGGRGRGLEARVRRFDDPDTWVADVRHRVVFPQLQGAQTL